MGSRPAPEPRLSAAAAIGRSVGNQRAVFPSHQPPRPTDEIPQLSPQSAVWLPPVSDGGASEERDGEFALGGAGRQAIENLQRAQVKEIPPAGTLPRGFPPAPGSRDQRPEGDQCGTDCAIIAYGRDLVCKSISGGQTVSQSYLHVLGDEADDEPKPAAIVEQCLGAGEAPKRKALRHRFARSM